MTLCYSYEVSTSGLGTFVRQLFRWKGSIYRLLYRELIIYLCLYTTLSLTYRFLLNAAQRTVFEKLCLFCVSYADFVPITMVLGFYVSWVVSRWWQWYMAIGWPDRISIYIATLVHGSDERGRMIRRTLVRYLNLANILVLRRVSLVAKKRFPELSHVRNAGFITETELEMYSHLTKFTENGAHHKTSREYDTFWVPLEWFCTLLSKARLENRIHSDPQLAVLVEEVSNYRDTLMNMICLDWISVPLVYTQVCTLAVYTYFMTCLFSRQYLDPTKGYANQSIDLYVPFFTILEFLFYVGWLKVAESLISPMGEQTDHYEINYIIDRNTALGYLFTDTFYNNAPSLQKDPFWNVAPHIPHTLASAGLMDNAYIGSAETIEIRKDLYAEAPSDQFIEASGNQHMSNIIRKFSTAVTQQLGFGRTKTDVATFGIDQENTPGMDDLKNKPLENDHHHFYTTQPSDSKNMNETVVLETIYESESKRTSDASTECSDQNIEHM